jgi:MFS family permease
MKISKRMFAVALAGFCTFLDLYAPQSLLPLFTRVFHASEVEVSLTISATTIAVALAAPIVGVCSDRLGRKRVISAAIFAVAVPTLLAATSTGLHQLIGWRFVQGLFMPGIFAVTMAYISEEWRGKGDGSAMAAYITGNVVGGFAGRFLSGLIAAQFGWRWAFVLLGILNLLGGIAVCIWLPASRHFVRQTSIRASVQAMGVHLRNPYLIAAYAAGFNILFSIVAGFTYVNFYLAAPPFQLGTVALGSIFFVYLIGAVITPIAGRWIDRVGYRTIFITALTIGCFGILLTLSATLWSVIAGLAVFATGIFICQSAATSYVGMAAGYARSSAAGLYVAFYYMGGSFGAIVPGFFWHLGGWFACVGLIVFIQFCTACLAFVYWRK